MQIRTSKLFSITAGRKIKTAVNLKMINDFALMKAILICIAIVVAYFSIFFKKEIFKFKTLKDALVIIIFLIYFLLLLIWF